MNIIDILKSKIENIYTNEPMSKHTSLKIGGPADIFIEAKSNDDVLYAIKTSRQYDIPLFILGNGSNILVGDKGIRGIVLHIANKAIELDQKSNSIYAKSGATLSAVAKFAQQNSLSGFEFASGIPGTVGGALIMNAGAYGGEMKDVVEYVDFADTYGNIHRYNNKQMDFAYRHSSLQNTDNIILGACFSLSEGEPNSILQYMQELNFRRAEKQPLEYPSCGSVFKRPNGAYAAALIENCGLKGLRNGGCAVSTKHAGFIINDRGASAREYLDLISMVQEKVFADTGFNLDTELRKIGEF